MSSPTENLLNQALKLPLESRAFLAEKLIQSLDAVQETELSDEWRAEIRKRSREIEEGQAELRDAEDVFARAYKSLE